MSLDQDKSNRLKELASKLSVSELDDLLFEADRTEYDERPVPIKTFLEDDSFLGDVIGKVVYPFWKNHLYKIFPTTFYSPYTEVIASLPIGAGKTTLSNISILYEIHKLLCLKNPQTFYGIYPAGLGIAFVLFSSVKYLADDVNWKGLKSMMELSPWFKRHIPELHLDKENMSVYLNKNVYIQLGSSSTQALGRAIFGGVLDEANFARGKSVDTAAENYSAILRRMESRFMQRGGSIPGKLFLVSSPRFATDFLSKRMEESRAVSRTYTIKDTPIWEVRKGSQKDHFSGETFPVFLGSETKDPRVLAKSGVIEGPHTIQVPVEFYESFESDLFSAIRDIAGAPVMGAVNLFKSVEKLRRMAVIPNKFTKEVVELDFKNPLDTVDKYADMEYFKNPTHPECHRWLHLDMGLRNDRLGLAAVYAVAENPNLEGMPVDEYGVPQIRSFSDRKFYMDWVLYVKAKNGEEVPIYKIRDWILLLKHIGYPLKKVTTDQFQSSDLRQQLVLQGIETDMQSVDKSKAPYLGVKNAVNSERLYLIDHPILIQELRELKEDDKKIDHPVMGSKDGADALAGAFWGCLNALVIYNQMYQSKDVTQQGGVLSSLFEGEWNKMRKKNNSWVKFMETGNNW